MRIKQLSHDYQSSQIAVKKNYNIGYLIKDKIYIIFYRKKCNLNFLNSSRTGIMRMLCQNMESLLIGLS